MSHYESIRRVLQRVRRRWRILRLFQATVRIALATSVAVGIALVAAPWTAGAPLVLVSIGVLTLLVASAAVVRGYLPLRHVPDDARVARFIEEQTPSLDDRLVSAVDAARSDAGEKGYGPFSLLEPMLEDAARRVNEVDIDTLVSRDSLRRAGLQAAAAVGLTAALFVAARGPAVQMYDAAWMTLFPPEVTLEVSPGNARVKSGSPFAIEARLVGNRTPVVARVEVAAGESWRAIEMPADAGAYRLSLPSVTTSFTYRVVAGSARSPAYQVSVVRAPRVSRIDLEYTFPPSLGLKPRLEEDGGDIYAPAGTDVRVLVHVDRPVTAARMTMAEGEALSLAASSPTILSASMRVTADNSYRVALDDGDGLSNPGDTEYFIRVLEDRPPEVRIVAPASDKSVTPLEEVDIAARAEDDYGIARLELVYSVKGEAERVVPLGPARPAPTAEGRHTLFVEDLRVRPGDIISYYVRARDVARGRRSTETKSDMYFLEVSPFDQQFRLSESQAQQGSGESIAELVRAQKEVIAATWRLERRGQAANGARSAEDIRAVSRAEAELRTRVERTASAFRETTMRDPRRRPAGRGQADAPQAGATRVEEDAMAAASAAMGRAVASLDGLKTAAALPPEMEALNHLLRAQTEITEREVSRQQAGNGNSGNNRTLDMSSLFDRELKEQQQTNYETKSSAEQQDSKSSMLDKIKDLARRQDELLKRQQELAARRDQMTAAELKRELEKLTREQTELRQQAEEASRQMSAQSGSSAEGRQLRDASQQMQGAASELRRDDQGKASANGSQALNTLRQLQRQMESAGPNEPLRALGEAQLEARQLAEAQRQIAAELRKDGRSDASQDAARRLAGEQERLAERAQRLQENLGRQASGRTRASTDDQKAAAAAGAAARDLEAQQLAQRMQQSAAELRAAAGSSPKDPRSQAAAQDDIARSLDRVAERLTAGGDSAGQKLSAQLAQAQELRDRMERLSDELDRQGQQPGQAGSDAERARLSEEYRRQLEETRKLLEDMTRDDPSQGPGLTTEGQSRVMSAPGTEAFKQDFADWDSLRRQASLALDRAQAQLDQAEAALLKKLQGTQSKERLAAGADDKAPAEYEEQVDSYFKALAGKTKP
jgi:hypothetical protein